MKLTFALTLILLSYSISSFAIKAVDIDKDKSKVIDWEEFKAYLNDKNTMSLGSADKDGDSELSLSEIKAANQHLLDAKEKNEIDLAVFKVDHPNGLDIDKFAIRYETDDVGSFTKKNAVISYLGDNKILIRDTVESIDFVKDQKKYAKAKAATISYAYDGNNENKIFLFKGAIMRPYQIDKDTLITPSIAFNHIKNEKNVNEEVDTLEFQLGFTKFFQTKDVHYYLSLKPTHTTDFSLKSSINSIQVQMQPISDSLNIQTPDKCGIFWFECLFRPVLHYEFGEVEDSGDSVLSEDSFSRIGLKSTLDIYPFRTSDKLVSSIGYDYLYSLTGNFRDRKKFLFSVTYALDDAGHFLLQSKYTNGDSSVKLEDEETFTLGLGVKF